MTIDMQILTVSKSQLKSRLLEYLRIVEKEKKPLIITHGGKPVAKIDAYREDADALLTSLRNSVVYYKDPFKPVGEEDWEALT